MNTDRPDANQPPSMLSVRSTRGDDAQALETLQIEVFRTLDDQQRFKRHHYLRHIELFPEGQFVAVDVSCDPERLVGMTSSVRVSFDFDNPGHRFEDIFQGGDLSAHEPDGPWLYGADIGTHPDYRRRGVARSLYSSRHETVRRLGLEGQVTVGMLRGFREFKDQMSAEQYYQRVLSGSLYDPTISTQMRLGFEPRGLIEDYLLDPVCDGWGVLLVIEREREIG